MRTAADRPPKALEREVLAGAVERVTFHNPENGFCVLRTRARGRRDLVTVVGHAATVAAWARITATGEWVKDRTRGQQFRAGFIRPAEPRSLDGIERYRGSGMIRGIGHALAEAMVEGHCVLPGEELGPHVATLLEVPAELIRAALDLELAGGAVVADSAPAPSGTRPPLTSLQASM